MEDRFLKAGFLKSDPEDFLELPDAVAVWTCDTYDEKKISRYMQEMFLSLLIFSDIVEGKRVAVKPNLVMAKNPEAGATTHPAVLSALCKLLVDWGAKEVVVVDSPGGPYTSGYLDNVYRTCGLTPLSKIPGVRLNDDFRTQTVTLDKGRTLHSCSILQTILDADVLIDVCKLKTHGLTGLSCATKNMFGCIPGVEKFSMHATFPKIEDFSDMLIDITEYLRSRMTYFAICDGIVGMEGNGPTHGVPVSSDVLMVAKNPYAMDVVAEYIIGCTNPVVHLDKAYERGLVPSRNWEDIEIYTEKNNRSIPNYNFTPPEASAGRFLKGLSNIWGGKFAEIFAAKPKVNKGKCVGCGVCVRSCPAHTIMIKNKKAVIQTDQCIRCYCCQELCPHDAIEMKKNFLIRVIH